MNILFIGNNLKNSDFIKASLKKLDLQIHCLCFQDPILETIASLQLDLILVDIDSQSADEMKVISDLREHGILTPLLVLSPHRAVQNLIPLVSNAESDFMLKPITVVELRARIATLMNRVIGPVEPVLLESAGVILDLTAREAYRDQQKISLQKNEFALLEYLMSRPGEVVTKTQILQKIWNQDSAPETNIVDVLVFRLRKKIDRQFQRQVIRTVRGVGYIFRCA
jgi:two-component system OmpR family response regulator